MSAPADQNDPHRLKTAIRLVLRRYARQVRARPWLATVSLVLPGDRQHLRPLRAGARDRAPARDARARRARVRRRLATPVLLLAARGLAARRCGGSQAGCCRGSSTTRLRALHIEAMDELFAKDVGFFHNNFAGSLTKRALGYARRFEDVFDVCAFSIAATCCRWCSRRRARAVLAVADRRACCRCWRSRSCACAR